VRLVRGVKQTTSFARTKKLFSSDGPASGKCVHCRKRCVFSHTNAGRCESSGFSFFFLIGFRISDFRIQDFGIQGLGVRIQPHVARFQGSKFRFFGWCGRCENSGFVVQGFGFWFEGSGFRVQGSGFTFQDSGIRDQVQGSGFRVQGSGFRVEGSGLRVEGFMFRVQGSGFRIRVQGSGFRIYGYSTPTQDISGLRGYNPV